MLQILNFPTHCICVPYDPHNKEAAISLYSISRLVFLMEANYILCAVQTKYLYIISNSLEQSPSWEDNRSSASQKIPRILCNHKVAFILRQINSVQEPHPISCTLIFILPFHLRLVLQNERFHQVSPPKPCTHLSSRYTCHMPCPSHYSPSDYPNNMWWGVQIVKLLVMQFPPASCYLRPPRPK